MDRMSDEKSEKAVTAKECAPLVGSTASCLWRMAEKNLIPCLRTGISGRGVRFIPSEVREALRARPVWINPTPNKGKKKHGNPTDEV